jgi:integrase
MTERITTSSSARTTAARSGRTEDWREWKAILKKAGVRDGRLHDARHTAATLLIEQGVHIRVVQECGHKIKNTLSSEQVTGEGAGGAEARGFEPRMDGKPKPH